MGLLRGIVENGKRESETPTWAIAQGNAQHRSGETRASSGNRHGTLYHAEGANVTNRS